MARKKNLVPFLNVRSQSARNAVMKEPPAAMSHSWDLNSAPNHAFASPRLGVPNRNTCVSRSRNCGSFKSARCTTNPPMLWAARATTSQRSNGASDSAVLKPSARTSISASPDHMPGTSTRTLERYPRPKMPHDCNCGSAMRNSGNLPQVRRGVSAEPVHEGKGRLCGHGAVLNLDWGVGGGHMNLREQ